MEQLKQFRFFIPTEIVFGSGVLNTLGERTLPGKKALLLTTNGHSTRANGYVDRVVEQLQCAGVSVVTFEEIEANPLRATVMRGAAAAAREACDFVVALGGGSCIDAAKAVAAMAVNPGDLWDYMEWGTGGHKPFSCRPLPIVSIPTTAGTGSEIDPWGAILNEDTNEKISMGNDLTRPVLAIIDPELNRSVPAKFTAYQGFDALFHASERYASKFANYLSDLFALEAIRHIARGLPDAVENGQQCLSAREDVCLGNLLAGSAMNLCAGLSHHPLENAMTAFHPNLPHGAGLLMICEAYFTLLAKKHSCDQRMVRMAQALGMQDASEPMDYVRMLGRLKTLCGVANLSMADYGITPEEFPALVKNARETMGGAFRSDRVPLSDEDCIAVYQASYYRDVRYIEELYQ